MPAQKIILNNPWFFRLIWKKARSLPLAYWVWQAADNKDTNIVIDILVHGK